MNSKLNTQDNTKEGELLGGKKPSGYIKVDPDIVIEMMAISAAGDLRKELKESSGYVGYVNGFQHGYKHLRPQYQQLQDENKELKEKVKGLVDILSTIISTDILKNANRRDLQDRSSNLCIESTK